MNVRSTTTFLGGLLSLAAATLSGFPLEMRIYPAVTRDDEKIFIFADRISDISLYFFKNGDRPVNMKDFSLELELPESVALRDALVVEGWVEGGKNYQVAKTASARTGYVKYAVPIPKAEVGVALDPNAACGFTGFYSVVFLSPGKGAPPTFSMYWKLKGEEGEVYGEQAFESVKFQPAARKPTAFQLWTASGSRYMDAAEIENQMGLYGGIGVTHVSLPRKNIYAGDEWRRWREKGFGLYDENLQQFVFRYHGAQKPERAREEYHVNIGGVSVHDSLKFRNTPWCPHAFHDPGSSLFKEMLAYVKSEMGKGVTAFFSDHEVDLYSLCYCPKCLDEFAAYLKTGPEALKGMKPLDIARKYPSEWYRFRTIQSGKMIAALRQALGDEGRGVKLGLNSSICYVNYKFGGLGFGRALFAEDARITDEYVDFHDFDSLSGGVMDAVLVDTVIGSLKKPVIARSYSNYCFGWLFAHCVSRHEMGKITGKGTGYDRRPEMQQLSMLNLAATGCQGLELLLGGAYDAAVVNAAARATEIIADHEQVWLKGKRVEQDLRVYPLPQGESPYFHDESSISGGIWCQYFLKDYGPLMYRAHLHEGALTVSVFNWDVHQAQKMVVVPAGLAAKQYHVYERSEGVEWVLDGKAKAWPLERLMRGIPVDVAPLGHLILTLSETPPPAGMAAKTVHQLDMPLKELKPYDLYRYRTQGEVKYGLDWAVENTYKSMRESKLIPDKD